MSINKLDARHRIKRSALSGVEPTIPGSSDFTDGTWLNTDTRPGEFFVNLEDRKLWMGITPYGSPDIGFMEIATIGGSTADLASVLASGNTTGANNIEISSSQSIFSGNGGGQLDLDAYGSANSILLSNDNAGFAKQGLYITDTSNSLLYDYLGKGIVLGTTLNAGGASQWLNGIEILYNGSVMVQSEVLGTGLAAVFINSKNSLIGAGVAKSVIIGGQDNTITAGNMIVVAGANNTNTDGDLNSFLGGTGNTNTLGDWNILSGTTNVNDYGSTNTFFGNNNSNTAGDKNFITGDTNNNTSGDNNSFFGAGNINTAGSMNFYTGSNNYNTIGGTNTFFGGGHLNTAGSTNFFTGSTNTNTAGGLNSFHGNFHVNTAGGYNFFVGNSNTNTIGNQNFICGAINTNISGAANLITGNSNVNTAGTCNIIGGQGNTTNQAVVAFQPASSLLIGNGNTMDHDGIMYGSNLLSGVNIGANGFTSIVTGTSNATPVVNTFVVPTNRGYRVKLTAIATDVATGDCKEWEGFGIIKNVAGTTSLVGAGITMTSTFGDAGLAATTITCAANNGIDTLDITVTGIAATTINWVIGISYDKVNIA